MAKISIHKFTAEVGENMDILWYELPYIFDNETFERIITISKISMENKEIMMVVEPELFTAMIEDERIYGKNVKKHLKDIRRIVSVFEMDNTKSVKRKPALSLVRGGKM